MHNRNQNYNILLRNVDSMPLNGRLIKAPNFPEINLQISCRKIDSYWSWKNDLEIGKVNS